MNRRTRDIVTRLIEQKEFNKITTINHLMDHFQVSERTIRYDLDEISSFLISKKQQPLFIGNNGNIEIQEDTDTILKLMQENDFYSFKLSKEERVDMISYLLATSTHNITLQQLADILFVSRSTIIHDVEDTRKKLSSFDLRVIPLSKGLVLQGRESDRRILIMSLLRTSNVNRYYNQYHSDHYFSKENEKTLKQMIRDAEIQNNLFLTDTSFEDLQKYLKITIEEQQKSRLVEIDYTVQHTSMMSLSESIIHHMSDVFATSNSLQERYLLGDILYNLDYLKRNDVDESLMKIQVVSKQFIDAVTYDLNIDLRDDFQFYQNLSNHLQSTFKDIQTVSQNETPLLKEVMKKNPQVVSSIRKNLLPLEEIVQRQLTEEEIAYITIHVCAAIERNRYHRPLLSVLLVCNSGIGTSQLLLSRLKKYFRFNIVDVLPSHALVAYDVENIDLIISTIPIDEDRCETIILHPYLSDEDCLLLGEKLEQIKGSKRQTNTDHDFLNLQTKIANAISRSPLDKDEIYKNIIADLQSYYFPNLPNKEPLLSELLLNHVAIDVEANDWEEAILKSAEVLRDEGYLNEVYMESMVLNVKENGPYIVLAPGFALPHESPSMGGKKLGMYLIRLKEPVEFHSENDPVDFVCCLSTIDKDSHLKAMFNLMNLLSKPSFLSDLRKAKSAQAMYQLINEYEEML